MNENYTYYIILLIFSLVCPLGLNAQNYFQKLEEPDKYYQQQIKHFSNGDLLIGNSSIEAVRTGNGGEIYLTRIDACGNVIWAKTYRREEEYLELKDLLINDAGVIFAYGSAYIGLDELIFFLKLDDRGNVLQFRLFEPETVDHFTYNIDLKGGRLMAYGLILDFSTKKFGFIAVFDEGLNFRWGKKFTPFSSSGEARITVDNGFICRSDQYLYKLDAQGDLEWATDLEPTANNSPVSGPLEVSDGYILGAAGDGSAFFYKVDRSGTLAWKSDQFPSKSFPSDMQLLPDGRVSAVYSAQNGAGQQLCRLLLTPDGEILQQEQLVTEVSIKPGRVFQSTSDNGSMAISVNPDPTVTQTVDAAGFLLVATPDVSNEACFEWDSFRAVQPNQVPMNFTTLDTAILATQMTFINNTNITAMPLESPLRNACADTPDLELIQIDTFLECGESWTVSLPSFDFIWQDNRTENPRELSEPGTYIAKNEDCGAQVIYEYTLEKPSCSCNTYLPTAFSPNEDGQNDYLEFFSDCTLSKFQMVVFSRWGEKLFESKVPGIFWDGHDRSKPAAAGVYLVKVDYEWVDMDGNLLRGSLTQNISLVR